MKRLALVTLVLFSLLFANVGNANAGKLLLSKGDTVAICGDSITEQKLYSQFIEAYLTACVPELELNMVQLGWGGERAEGFALRMENDLMPWQPDVVTTCYGMNDGQYRKYDEKIGEYYRTNMLKIAERMKKGGVKTVIGSPGVVDSYTWKRDLPDFDKVYNENLGKLGQIAKEIAVEYDFAFTDVHNLMAEVMAKAKAKYGQEYPVAGFDGVHPIHNGHLVMAYAFLRALGLDGKIGIITIDMNGPGECSQGHKVITTQAGEIQVLSSRYPFCLQGKVDDPRATTGIVEFFGFNQDLNRLMLVVKNLKTKEADVVWAQNRKRFTRKQLEDGINLSAEFVDNPFSRPFANLLQRIAEKQKYETTMIKNTLSNFRNFENLAKKDAELKAAFETVRKKLTEKHSELSKNVRDAVVPVQYLIKVEPVK
ncbi:MAG: SGNH/GDSL hydrolase family protein [Planctomycetes bacterium]|nr:SGNH/GDSL hydrolase family protein [Planctomycetota bacterium]MBL7106645.1 SGNH/GDSL hydrolase family protein [Phycisphaerae bacterium]